MHGERVHGLQRSKDGDGMTNLIKQFVSADRKTVIELEQHKEGAYRVRVIKDICGCWQIVQQSASTHRKAKAEATFRRYMKGL